MKRRALLTHLKKCGCEVLREGGKHTILGILQIDEHPRFLGIKIFQIYSRISFVKILVFQVPFKQKKKFIITNCFWVWMKCIRSIA